MALGHLVTDRVPSTRLHKLSTRDTTTSVRTSTFSEHCYRYEVPIVDTAQGYRNEGEVGIALHESGFSRGEVFITTKYSGYDGYDIPTSIRNSVNNVSELAR